MEFGANGTSSGHHRIGCRHRIYRGGPVPWHLPVLHPPRRTLRSGLGSLDGCLLPFLPYPKHVHGTDRLLPIHSGSTQWYPLSPRSAAPTTRSGRKWWRMASPGGSRSAWRNPAILLALMMATLHWEPQRSYRPRSPGSRTHTSGHGPVSCGPGSPGDPRRRSGRLSGQWCRNNNTGSWGARATGSTSSRNVQSRPMVRMGSCPGDRCRRSPAAGSPAAPQPRSCSRR